VVKESAAHCNAVFYLSTVVSPSYFAYLGYHQYYLGVLGLHMVAFHFVWFVGCGCLECSRWDGSSVVFWPAIIVATTCNTLQTPVSSCFCY
jgi:hypothetical protein